MNYIHRIYTRIKAMTARALPTPVERPAKIVKPKANSIVEGSMDLLISPVSAGA
jgi:hypothetical protein